MLTELLLHVGIHRILIDERLNHLLSDVLRGYERQLIEDVLHVIGLGDHNELDLLSEVLVLQYVVESRHACCLFIIIL